MNSHAVKQIDFYFKKYYQTSIKSNIFDTHIFIKNLLKFGS